MTSSDRNFANKFVKRIKDTEKNSDVLKCFANFFTAIANGKNEFDNKEAAISMLKLQNISNNSESAKKAIHP